MIDESPTPGFTFGMRMGSVREEHGLTMSEMAKSVGVSPSTWKNYENDITFPGQQTIANFCSIYHVNEEWLNTNCGWIYEDGYTPGDPLGEPVDYKKRIMDQARDLEKQYWIAVMGQDNYDKLMEEQQHMTKEELIRIRESLNLTKAQLAEKLSIKPTLLGRYESGSCKIPENIVQALQTLTAPPAEEEDLPTFIANVRSSLSLSKAAFAKLIGVSASAAGNYESGKNKPKDEILKKIKELAKNEESAEKVMPFPAEKTGEAAPVEEKKEKASPRKKTTSKKSGAAIIIQSKMGGSITPEEILSRVPADTETIYIKPEENAAYWVKGNESGSVELW
ncbi:MAG: helix-turn-helix domain-containing protein [Blautia sp.]|nr:helix-turn-helix domain-containing protein [Blautia sp.]